MEWSGAEKSRITQNREERSGAKCSGVGQKRVA